MKFLRTALAGALAVGMVASASAANCPMAPPAPPPPLPTAPAFDWSGPYVGAYTGWVIGTPFIFLGAQAGYNFTFGNFLVGAEVNAGTVFSGPPFNFGVKGRLGYVAAERLLIYGFAGYDNFGPLHLGGGLEYAVGSNLSLRAETSVYCCWSPVIIKAGINYHF